MSIRKNKKIAVIGGGAAGFFAAISAATHQKDHEVIIYEASGSLLGKVLISGGGRCNVTNNSPDVTQLIKGYPRGSKELRGPFSRFAVLETIQWFKDQGVTLKTEPDGRMFPISDSSQTIADCLINRSKELGVEILTRHKVTKIIKNNDGKYQLFFGHNNEESSPSFDQVILTTGGSKASLKLAESLGHTITELIPSLFSFHIKDPRLTDLSGVSFTNAKLAIHCDGKKHQQTGPILITHWGLSGPATIKLSALAAKELFHHNYQAALTINFTGDMNSDFILAQLNEYKTAHPKATVAKVALFNIPKRYWSKILEISSAKIKPIWSDLSKKELQALVLEITQATFQIRGKGIFKEEFVTCGGVCLKEVNFQTMESKVSPGLYFAGEVLDIDGITGGYNFQSAWTTGWIAGLK